MAFEQYKKDRREAWVQKKRAIPIAHVTITLAGSCYFSSATVLKYNLGNYYFVVLYFEEEKRKIGFQMVTEPTAHTVKLASTNQEYGYIISLQGALSQWGIDMKTFPVRQFELQKLEGQEDFFFIDLNKPLESKKDE